MKVPEEVLRYQEAKQKELLAENKRKAQDLLLSIRLQLSSQVDRVTSERKRK